jgi:Putative zinc-finger
VEAGAYVLGALPPAERAAYERHLPGCPTCRDEVAELAGLPGLLGRLDAGTAASIGRAESAPRALLDTLLIRAGTERRRARRRSRWQRPGVMLVAASLAAVVGFGVATMDHPAGPRPVVAALQPLDDDLPVSALVGYTGSDQGGTDLVMSCVYERTGYSGGPKSWNLTLVVFPRGSTSGLTVSSWETGPAEERLVLSWHLALPPGQIGRIELRHGITPLLVYQPT